MKLSAHHAHDLIERLWRLTDPRRPNGKTLKGARQEDGRQTHLLSAFLYNLGITVAQCEVESKTNEITCVRLLLDGLEVKGRVVSLDALHTQHDTARYLVQEKDAGYFFTVKDNQPTLRSDTEALNLADFPPQHETIDKGHGRLEVRQIWTSSELNDYLNFPYGGQVFCIRREITKLKTNKTSQGIVFGMTSPCPEKANPARVLKLNRGHWGIENRLHWVRDVTFDEDRSQIRTLLILSTGRATHWTVRKTPTHCVLRRDSCPPPRRFGRSPCMTGRRSTSWPIL